MRIKDGVRVANGDEQKKDRIGLIEQDEEAANICSCCGGSARGKE